MAVDESGPLVVPSEGEEVVGNFHRMESSDVLVGGEHEVGGN